MLPHHLHAIQRTILERLRITDRTLRYSDLRLQDVENDLFNYHLQQLVKRGLVTKAAGNYVLSSNGKKYLVDLNPLDAEGLPQRIKLAAMCIVVDATQHPPRLLYQLRSRQPLASRLQMIGGGLLRGELPTDAAARRLREESNLLASFRLVGFIRFRRYEPSGTLYSDILFHVCIGRDPVGELAAHNEYGHHTWLTLDEAVAHEAAQPGGITALQTILPGLVTFNSQDPLFYIETVETEDL